MINDVREREELLAENEELRRRLEEAEEVLSAIGGGEVDALVVTGLQGEQVFTLQGADHPYRILVETMHDGAANLDPEGTIIYCNRRLSEMLQIPLEQLIGTRLVSRIAPADHPFYTGCLQGNRECTTGEISLVNAAGEELPALFSCCAAAFGGGRVVSAVFTDVSELKRAQARVRVAAERERAAEALREREATTRRLNLELEQRVKERTAELERSNRELEAFCYTAAHDLSTPLRSMNGFCSIILEDHAGSLDEAGTEYLERIRASSVRMGRLIDDLLELSRISRVDLRRQQVDLSALVAEIAKNHAEYEPQRRVEVKVAEGVETVGDPVLLRVVLDNLFNNAWKYTGTRDRAEILFGSEEFQGDTVYYLRDNGIGFDMSYVGKIFTPFERLHRVNEFAGTGVGLATVQRIVTKHGGSVWAEGEVDNGATFYFTIAPEPGERPGKEEELAESGMGGASCRPEDPPGRQLSC